MTPEEKVIERFEEGTNLGTIRTLRFYLRYVGDFNFSDRAILYNKGMFYNEVDLPGERMSIACNGKGERFLMVFDEKYQIASIYHIHTVAEVSRSQGRFLTWKDYWWMKIRNWWWNRWH